MKLHTTLYEYLIVLHTKRLLSKIKMSTFWDCKVQYAPVHTYYSRINFECNAVQILHYGIL